MLDLKKIDRLIADLERRGIEFGYCPDCNGLTPALIDAGPEGVSAECAVCSRANWDRSSSRRYVIGLDIPRRYEDELRILSDPLAQRAYLVAMLEAAVAEIAQRKDSLTDQLAGLSKKTVEVVSRLAQLQ